jgi:glyoxylase-like metal-dependent hydrolase (beta-lactamase superfamily II)
MEVVEGVHWIRDRFLKNIYLVTDGGPVLVDTGLPGSASPVVLCLDRIGVARGKLKAIILTHSHFDHIGSAERLRGATGAQIWAHTLDAPRIEGDVPARGYGSSREMLTHSLTRLRKVRVDRTLRDGDIIDCLGGLLVIHTPGHTEGSICLYQKERGILFSGDTIQYNGGRIRKPIEIFCHDSEALDKSIRKLAELDFEHMLSGEGVPLLGGAARKVREFLRISNQVNRH